MTRTIATCDTGKSRTICNTDHPITHTVAREALYGRVRWVVTWGICNGTAEGAETHRTRKAALQHLEALRSQSGRLAAIEVAS